ncbi:MAG TPA: hypothetical protein VK539_37280 [Myxococcaceae bacterium]|nr:hypothetical protein [Myxococcaceae bacterium]
MGRKSREKRERRAAWEEAETLDEVVEIAPGIIEARKGRLVFRSSTMSPDEHRVFLEELKEQARELPAQIDARVRQLQSLLSSVPILQLLTNLAAETFANNPETYKEYEVSKPAILVEYATWLAITSGKPYRFTAHPLDWEQYAKIRTLLESLIQDTIALFELRPLLKGNDTPGKLDQIIFRTQTEHLLVRQYAYPHHQATLLKRLFAPFDPRLKDAVGFSIEEALALVDAISSLINNRLNEHVKRAAEATRNWLLALNSNDALAKLDDKEKRIVEQLRDHSDPKSKIQSLTSSWLGYSMELVFIVAPRQLSQRTGISERSVEAFLTAFSLGFSEPPIGDNRPSVYEPLERSPLIGLGNNSWSAHLAPSLLLTAIQPGLEKVLRSTGKTWHAYERHRASLVESDAVELLCSVSFRAKKGQKLFYQFDNGHGVQRFELDGLVTIDTVAFIVEAKAGLMRAPGRRGAEKGVVEDLKKIVGDAHEQALRAIRYINAFPEVSFEDKSGNPVLTIRRADLTRIIPVAVTLDNLDAFVTRIADLEPLGIIPAGVLPWAVSLQDLRVIVEHVEGAGQFVHYLERRQELESTSVTAHDELDWLGNYMKEGLYFKETDSQMPLALGSFTTEFDEYYMHQAGVRQTPATKLRQKMPAEIRELMLQLEKTAPHGFVEAICLMLGGDEDSRQLLAGMIRQRKSMAAKKEWSGCRIQHGDSVIAYVSAKAPSREMLEAYTTVAKYEAKATFAVGICQALHSPEALMVALERGTWTPDPQKEHLSISMHRAVGSRVERGPARRKR